ncbi:DUF2326 domain-containing protein [Thermoanaerobacterium saccharolyticum]|uniref:Uncharacterized protein YydD (DUF2326 family) n=1 Tax=Thermoanaerobacterium butyriciformans TaxID=1702242 RepID=A0ABS4NCN3_9THEO|nr:DUF2326 domain-containing protein [Thermoanaerobacterium butyriciformans]MBP2071390.1 uncharacterized protein YydD (DUF2326 family) [Thermoanaerobacterium butyriciformans]
MKLLELRANQSTFHTIKFKDGLNFIIGRRENPLKSDLKKTYNGVGKSLLIYLIHFCLGSRNTKPLTKKLHTWEFTLDFKIEDDFFSATRNCSDPKYIILNNEKIKVEEFNRLMGEKIFYLTDEVLPGLSFRALISRFVRPSKESYSKFDVFHPKEDNYTRLLNNAYLLGLDPYLIERKKNIKEKMDSIKMMMKNYKNDEIFKEYFNAKAVNLDIELYDLEEQTKKLKINLQDFKIAENYGEIKEKADKVKQEINQLENEIILMEKLIENINKSLQITIDVSKDKIIKLYEEAKVQLPEMIKKTLKEVEEFNLFIKANREKRLLEQKFGLEKHIDDKKSKLNELYGEYNSHIKYLKEHGAIDDYVKLNELLNELENKKEKIEQYKTLEQEYKAKKSELKIQFEEENKKTQDYLTQITNYLKELNNIFRNFSREFYKDKPGGIEIKNNIKNNKTRFDIEVKIQDDSSDGINEVKVFCYDLTVLSLRQNHKVKFLFHDSRLFTDMDPRQRIVWLHLINEFASKNDIQYIASLNEDMLLSLQDNCSKDEFEKILKIVENNKILTLTDKSPESKLLGIQIDLAYEDN